MRKDNRRMRINSWIAACIFATAAGLPMLAIAPASRADEPEFAATSAMPEREQALLSILGDAQKKASTTSAKEARLTLQLATIAYMHQSVDIDNWIGMVQSWGMTPEGNGWITIAIGNGATISTWKNRTDDRGFGSLLRPHTPLFIFAKNAQIGQMVAFSGTFLKSLLAGDDEMVQRPQFVARLSALKFAE